MVVVVRERCWAAHPVHFALVKFTSRNNGSAPEYLLALILIYE